MPGDTVSVIRPRTYEEAASAVRDCAARGAVARGGPGRAYGDAARNSGGTVLDMTGLDRVHVVDADEGIVLCGSGVLLHRLAELMLPLGWFVPVAPATGRATVGGAIGADVHGGNHPVSGSFSHHVLSLELLTADGEVRTVKPGTELFAATAGGMGLTGVILTATIRLLPVETAYLTVDTERAADLDDLMARLTDGDHRRYGCARIDLTARGADTGRAVLTRADHTPLDALRTGTRAWRHPLSCRPRRRPPALALLSGGLPGSLLGRTSAGLLGGLRYRTAPRARSGELRPLSADFPALAAPQGTRRTGCVRYRFAVGHGQEETLHRIVRRLAAYRCGSFHAVLQPLGDTDAGWLSFPLPGWTLALDIPAALPGLAGFLDGLDEEVAAAGGRVCLAEDSRLRPGLLTTMYPRAADFRTLRARLDPRGVFVSDLARRLDL
ncbi:decaprenylphosphoryl-beta-D-ribose oxidase [Streptomyces fodineus]|uniref:Decaprenylphosphoryl-beta-D-ribose oxidase n=1 Tax=Streptomyces fodineus TaxID=1904616 RepID=A0A1D7YAG2_9ACTN|nr:FAD-binding oxidoreductase [Streptomyces fodineus]AOR32494.1 decaprenylphosphoryl-beta-D-ribose oxidase [Streptomyces fodineus]